MVKNYVYIIKRLELFQELVEKRNKPVILTIILNIFFIILSWKLIFVRYNFPKIEDTGFFYLEEMCSFPWNLIFYTRSLGKS